LKTRLDQYDEWLRDGKISFSSKIVPISRSLESKQWIMPTKQAMDHLKNARTFALTDCICRSKYRRCDKPLDVCFLLDDFAEEYVAKGLAKKISFQEAEDALERANESGLVHLTLYQPDHEIFALCNCCPCCCHDLQLMMKHGRDDLVVRADYLAETDPEQCSDCGICVDACVFGARTMQDDRVRFDPEKCYGCGLCVPACPESAIGMATQKP
jgi:ferredoxin